MCYVAYITGQSKRMTTVINQTMTYSEMADIIYTKFELNQSCKVVGYVEDHASKRLDEKGQLVLNSIKAMDDHEHVVFSSTDGRPRRKRKKLPNTIGDFVASKIFKWERVINEDEGGAKFTIWRIQ